MMRISQAVAVGKYAIMSALHLFLFDMAEFVKILAAPFRRFELQNRLNFRQRAASAGPALEARSV